jgi:hypothetical protein
MVGAQTSSTTTGPGSLPQAFLLPAGTSTESVQHGQVTVDIGIERRFSESPGLLADADISASQVINARRLQAFTRHIALTEPVKEMDIGEDAVRVHVTGQGKLVGLIPVDVDYEITAEIADDGSTSVETEHKSSGWWLWMAQKPSPETISNQVEEIVSETEYISITQLRAVILEAIVDTV